MQVSFNRIILFGKNVDGLKKFYQENFHFELIEEIKNEWVVLKAGLLEIAFHKIGDTYLDSSKPFRANSNTKLVFYINADLPTFRKEMLLKGIIVHEIKSFEPLVTLHFDGEDFESNVFQVVEKLS
ncbi:MAG: hypothetical protein ABI402_10490 [Ferruginibacter sp.]